VDLLGRIGLRYNEEANAPGAQTKRRGEAGPVSVLLRGWDSPADFSIFLSASMLDQATSSLFENIEVVLNGSVAVAVMNWPGATVTAKPALKIALPVASVVTVIEPR
jgi:hypothetical protein